MIVLVHDNIKIIDVLYDSKRIETTSFIGVKICDVFFEIAEDNLDDLIVWCHYKLQNYINKEGFIAVFHHQKILASYSTTNVYPINNNIGYVDESPFVNINPRVKYPTWLMSGNIGGAYGKVLSKFKFLLQYNLSFSEVLNYIGKLGQQRGLLCYSAPELLNSNVIVEDLQGNLFFFVKNFYKKRWLFILLFNKLIYDNSVLLFPFLKSIFRTKIIKKEIDLNDIDVKSNNLQNDFSIDVVIPTIGRKNYLKNVLHDLSNQTLLPKNVIIVEQEEDGVSELDFLNKTVYPFKIYHRCITQLGACNARNIALKKIVSNWVFLADDDVAIQTNTLENTKKLIESYGVKALTISCLQEGELDVVDVVLQSQNFGSGTSIVKSEVLEGVFFKKEHELGYGEDIDFGMQIRNKGVDVIYSPFIKMLHYKAPIGGFRTKINYPWISHKVQPKPSPTVMAYKIKHYTEKQLKGYKTNLFAKFYKNQEIKNPITYIKSMNRSWAISRKYAEENIKKGQNEV